MPALANNPRARFDYEILETFEAGLVLRGHEVKSARDGKLHIKGSRVIVRDNAAYLVGATIQPYQPGNTPADFDPERTIQLLLGQKEIKQLIGVEKEKGLTIVPLELYNKSGRLKLSLAIGRGKKKFDKRETIKKRETDREVRRTLKRDF